MPGNTRFKVSIVCFIEVFFFVRKIHGKSRVFSERHALVFKKGSSIDSDSHDENKKLPTIKLFIF